MIEFYKFALIDRASSQVILSDCEDDVKNTKGIPYLSDVRLNDRIDKSVQIDGTLHIYDYNSNLSVWESKSRKINKEVSFILPPHSFIYMRFTTL